MADENWKKCAECGSEIGERYYDSGMKVWLCRKCFHKIGYEVVKEKIYNEGR